ncbi:hypothetical protein HDU76_004497 [Blyttiomyces sp. JEL0837]|nr:hypothetical protein HDU76_004497 [Blyttiomyces sp. JEL0837]
MKWTRIQRLAGMLLGISTSLQSLDETSMFVTGRRPKVILNGSLDDCNAIYNLLLHQELDCWKRWWYGVHFPEIVWSSMVDFQNQGVSLPLLQIFGYASHNLESSLKIAIQSKREKVDYIQLGTMFTSSSHPEKSKVEGPELLVEVSAALKSHQTVNADSKPPYLIAVGGVTSKNVKQLLDLGADGVAVISDILSDPTSPRDAAVRIRKGMDEWISKTTR